MFCFRRNYFLLMVLLLVTEVLIALFVRDKIIRPYAGDYLVVILLYCFVRAFFTAGVWKTAIGVLLFAYSIEVLQHFEIIKLLGWNKSSLAKTVIGYEFEWIDMLAYTLGVATVLWLDGRKRRKPVNLRVASRHQL